MTETQSLRYGHVTDVITHTMVRDLADDIAAQLDAADVARTTAQKRPAAYAKRNAAQSMAAGVTTTITFDVEVWDTHAMIDLSGAPQNQRITCGATAGIGIYLIQASGQLFMSGWTRGDIILSLNGTAIRRKTYVSPQDLDVLQLTAIVYLAATSDFLTLGFYHEGGGSTNTSIASLRALKLTNS